MIRKYNYTLKKLKRTHLGIEGANVILNKVVCESCQVACETYVTELRSNSDYWQDKTISEINKIYLVKQSGNQFVTHECDRIYPLQAVVDSICFCNAHVTKLVSRS